MLFIPVLWEYLKRYNFSFIRSLNLKVLSTFLIPMGTLSFFTYHYLRFHDFFLFFKVESWWGRAFKLNKAHFLLFSNSAIANFLLDLSFVIVSLIITYFVFKKLRISYGLYMLETIIAAISTGTLMSIGRYVLILFPTYILLASIKKKYLQEAWVFASTLFLALYTTLFVTSYWAG